MTPAAEPLEPGALYAAARVVLADPGSRRPAGDEDVARFCRRLAHREMDWFGFVARSKGAIVGVTLVTLLPGRTASVMVPEPGTLSVEREAVRGTLLAAMRELDARDLYYAQTLLEPGSRWRPQLLREAGFERISRLEYMLRSAAAPVPEPPPLRVQWRSYDADLHTAFGETILATYRDSRDMPELADVRPIDDVLATHRAAGAFDPRLWELAYVEGVPAGCLLLAGQFEGRVVEIVYVGVVPSMRGRGLGRRLLCRAIEQARQCGADHVLVAVDVRNGPARRLYGAGGFRALVSREVFVRPCALWPQGRALRGS